MVDDEPITSYELTEFVRQRTGGQPGVDPAVALDAFITEKIIEKEISDKGIVVRDEDVDRQIEAIRAQNNLTKEQMQQSVESLGLTWDQYRKKVREEIARGQLINREIRGKVNVTPEEVQRYYDEHKGEYSTPGRAHVRHIVLLLPKDASPQQVDAVMERARELREQLDKGDDFAALAQRYSQDAAASSGGDLGWLDQGEMLEEFEAAIAKLKPGEVSDPVRTAVGVHLIMVEEVTSEGHTAKEEMAGEIKQRLYNAALEERYERWLKEDLRERHHVEIRP